MMTRRFLPFLRVENAMCALGILGVLGGHPACSDKDVHPPLSELSCDDLEDCEWQHGDCLDFRQPDTRQCVKLNTCGGTKLATEQEACALQCSSETCSFVQSMAELDCDPNGMECKIEDACLDPGEPYCQGTESSPSDSRR